jgi:hypothetical protein
MDDFSVSSNGPVTSNSTDVRLIIIIITIILIINHTFHIQ